MTLPQDLLNLAKTLHTTGQTHFAQAINATDKTTREVNKYQAHTYQGCALAINQILAAHGEPTSYEPDPR